MSPPVYIRGLGVVSPAGWGLHALRDCLRAGQPLPLRSVSANPPAQGRTVAPPQPRPPILAHPRLRRSSSISQFAAVAAQEAVTQAGCQPADLGIVFSTMCGSVRYTQRFHAEIRVDPTTASPILFPETVFNAPTSHIAAALAAAVPTYTLVGDSSVFLQALALGAQWVTNRFVRYALVVAAEELDWSAIAGWRLFAEETALAEGAAALCLSLERGPTPGPVLAGITEPVLFKNAGGPLAAARDAHDQGPPPEPQELLVDGRIGLRSTDTTESLVWADWPGHRTSPKQLLGEGMSAAVGWQCVVAVDHLQSHPEAAPFARVVALGCNHQAIVARFRNPAP